MSLFGKSNEAAVLKDIWLGREENQQCSGDEDAPQKWKRNIICDRCDSHGPLRKGSDKRVVAWELFPINRLL